MVGQRQDVCQGDDVDGMAVVDHPVGPVGGRLPESVVHKVGGKLGSGLAAVLQVPDDVPTLTCICKIEPLCFVDFVPEAIFPKFILLCLLILFIRSKTVIAFFVHFQFNTVS